VTENNVQNFVCTHGTVGDLFNFSATFPECMKLFITRQAFQTPDVRVEVFQIMNIKNVIFWIMTL
jgi:hypothetical protein